MQLVECGRALCDEQSRLSTTRQAATALAPSSKPWDPSDLDTFFSLLPELGARYRPALSGGLGGDGPTAPVLPDGVWLRGTLGYDFRPTTRGAVHADIGLASRWRLGS